MSKCAGENCKAVDGVGHSRECLFGHFLSYTGYAKQPAEVREMLERAYYDGMDAEAARSLERSRAMQKAHNKEMMEQEREFQREAREIAAEERWKMQQGDEYGSY